ncbi:MAG: putative dipeptidase PepE [Alphaproteobacteria bacterium MarineAlpha2_Bin1]|nr:MAG: putative dipeptidase PepE [Alphaproteobacteria bacterium MarineAlpha2_Bin1]|tara:strand:- start:442 stop:1683 length:1242 start_codon:yes stop_codon:yes gene_type:complete
MLLNKSRAYEIMDKYKLDALLAVNPRNIYYLTDFSGFNNRTQRNFYEYALFPRKENAPAAYVTTAVELPRLSDFPTWVPNIQTYTHPVGINNRDYDTSTEDTEAGIPINWPIRKHRNLPDREKQWLELKRKYGENVSASPLLALKKAFKDALLDKATIGTDDPRVINWLNEAGLESIKPFEATNIFREIRMVKSPDEIKLLTKAAQINEQGMQAAIDSVKEGVDWQDIELNFFNKVSSLGGQGVYITAGPGGLPHQSVVSGKPIMLDSLSTYKLYHGDLGRTVIVGDPSKEVLKRNKAMIAGWEKAVEIIKPGLTGSKLTSEVLKVMDKKGFPGFIIVTPHSIGLEHTDHPLPIGNEMPGSKGDFIFLENMVVNVDMPYHEYAWGSMHLEDTLVITANGCRAITSEKTKIVIK